MAIRLTRQSDGNQGAVTVSCAATVLPYCAEIVPDKLDVTVAAVTVNVAVADPAGTNTLGGTLIDVEFEESNTVMPPGAAAVSVTVPCNVPPDGIVEDGKVRLPTCNVSCVTPTTGDPNCGYIGAEVNAVFALKRSAMPERLPAEPVNSTRPSWPVAAAPSGEVREVRRNEVWPAAGSVGSVPFVMVPLFERIVTATVWSVVELVASARAVKRPLVLSKGMSKRLAPVEAGAVPSAVLPGVATLVNTA